MKIGLIRHFKVAQPRPSKFFIPKSEVLEWFEAYNTAGVHANPLDLSGHDWAKCYSSPMTRALTTAQTVYPGKIMEMPALAELNTLSLLPDTIPLPHIAWALMLRHKSLQKNELTNAFKAKLEDFVESQLTQKKENTLIVSHGFTMKYLHEILFQHGYKGPKLHYPQNGKLYLYER